MTLRNVAFSKNQARREKESMQKVPKEKSDSLPIAIAKVLNDYTINDKTKLERIETYIEVYFNNKKPTISDME